VPDLASRVESTNLGTFAQVTKELSGAFEELVDLFDEGLLFRPQQLPDCSYECFAIEIGRKAASLNQTVNQCADETLRRLCPLIRCDRWPDGHPGKRQRPQWRKVCLP